MPMHTWFECKIRYEEVMENGMLKRVAEPYLADALNFTKTEAQIIEEMTPFISGEFTVSDIKRANYNELFPSDEESADRWFKCKLVFITLDEKNGVRKKTSTQVLMQAADLHGVVKKLDEGVKGTMADYQINSTTKAAVMGVYPYAAENIKERIGETVNSPVVRNFLASLLRGYKTVIAIAGKLVVVGKTDSKTKVTPNEESQRATGERESGDNENKKITISLLLYM